MKRIRGLICLYAGILGCSLPSCDDSGGAPKDAEARDVSLDGAYDAEERPQDSAPSAPDGVADSTISDDQGPRVEPARWRLIVNPEPVGALNPALLGQYDLSGALFDYAGIDGLAEAMRPAGFVEWRVSVGRWEAGTLMLPTLSDGTPCPPAFSEQYAPDGSSDDDLINARDWFSDDGQPVTLGDTEDDSRYQLGYVREVLNQADLMGAVPFLSIDLMPRALAINQIPSRTDQLSVQCDWSFSNDVSNAPPADVEVFAAAAAGLVKRLVEGVEGEAPYPLTYVELWNEPDLPYFWSPRYDPDFQIFGAMVVHALLKLAGYRANASHEGAARLRFGLGSFAEAGSAAGIIGALDQADLPGGVPVDFFSFHSYHDDPLEVVADIKVVTHALKSSADYQSAELALAEWGPSLTRLGDAAYYATMTPALHLSTVIARGANLGLDRAHKAIFYDYFSVDALQGALLSTDLTPRPIFYAYQMMSELIGGGADRLEIEGANDDRFDEGMGSFLIAKDGSDVRVLAINRLEESRTLSVDLGGGPARPSRVSVFDSTQDQPRELIVEQTTIEISPQSITLLTFSF